LEKRSEILEEEDNGYFFMNREQAKKELSEICIMLGCSGMNKECPGDHKCSIIRKIMRKK